MANRDADAKRVREYWKGRASFLGHYDAEHDSLDPGWARLFIPLSASNRIRSGEARVVVGRKGSGKTASHIWATQEIAYAEGGKGTDSRFVVSAKADELVNEYLSDADRNAPGGMISAWLRAYRFELLRKVAQNLSGEMLTNEALQVVRQWAIETGRVTRDLGERIVHDALEILPKLKGYVSNAHENALGRAHVEQALRGRQLFLYVDDFDNIYSSGKRAIGIDAVQSAIEAADRLSATASGPRVSLMLREDLWLLVRNNWHYADKLSQPSELRWAEDELKEFVRQRLRHAAALALGVSDDDVRYTFAELWEMFFPENITLENGEISSGFHYILRRTLYTPRDLQQYLNRVADNAPVWPAQQPAIVKAEEGFSLDRLSYLASEFGTLCDDLHVAMLSFSGHSLEWGASELYGHLRGLIGNGSVRLKDPVLAANDPHDFARFLFRIGFLEVRYPRTDGSGWERRDSLAYPTHWEGIRPDDSVKWAVRSAFFRSLRSHARSDVFTKAKNLESLGELAKGSI